MQVTLQILKALIEKLPRDLPLYAQYVLRILGNVLRSKDLSMVEESIPTFEAFCQYHDVATLAADQDHIGQYEDIVRTYTSYASLKTPVQPKGGLSAPIAIRWRGAGLRALKSITSSEAVGADGGRQLNMIMPVILQNLHSGDEESLRQLQLRAETPESSEMEQVTRRRMSIATVRTTEDSSRVNTTVVIGTADDADRLAEEEVKIQAIKSLKQIFVANNRAQVRLATGAILKFICTKVPYRRPESSRSSRAGATGTWATTLMEMVTTWTPVQDRFIILVTIMETVVRSPVAEENLEQQLLLISLVGWLLKSSINMIGLSVMDVLLGLVQHILLLLQLGGKGSNVLPHHQQTDAIDLFKGAGDLIDGPTSPKAVKQDDESLPSSNRQDLLNKLQRCIGDLATHIYYSDQISDMITAILLRLKPSPMSSVKSDAAAVENPQAAAQAILTSVRLQENPETDEFFSFGTARVTALKAIKEVLATANLKGTVSGGAAIGRNRVGVQVWEGTQWLLRDEDRRVRRAYVDALLTWLKLEMSSNDLRVLEDKRKLMRSASKTDFANARMSTMTKRAVSNASHRSKTEKPSKSTFLELLHLAIYDNAIEDPEAESDLLLLHLLLVSLVEKLGVNAAKSGLPMIMRLQEDINIDNIISTPTAKMDIGSLVHGYLWKLSDKFDFDTTKVGFAVQSEISRRKQYGLWLDTIQIPPLPLDQIMSATSRSVTEKPPLHIVQTESLKPFDFRSALVDKIAESYANAVASPPNSPPSSPGRVFSMPILSSQGPTSSPNSSDGLPPKIIEAMLSEWSKELCISSVEKESARSISLNGSRKGTNLSQYLNVNGQGTRNASPNGTHSPLTRPTNGIDNQPQALNFAFQNSDHRRSSNQSGSPTPNSSSDQNHTLRVDDLKRVLAGGPLTHRGASPLRHNTAQRDFGTPSRDHHSARSSISSSSSSSNVDAEGFDSASEGDLSRRSIPPPLSHSNHTNHDTSRKPPVTPIHTANYTTAATAPSTNHSRNHSRTNSHPRSRPLSNATDPDLPPSTPRSLRRPSTSSSNPGEDPIANAAALRGEIVIQPRLSSDAGEGDGDDEVPPVPPLPKGVRPLSLGGAGANPPPLKDQVQHLEVVGDGPEDTVEDDLPVSRGQSSRSKKSKGDRSSKSSSMGRKRGVDVEALLGSIDASVAGSRRVSRGPGRPPF